MGLGPSCVPSFVGLVVRVVAGRAWLRDTGEGNSTGPRCRGTGSREPVNEDERWWDDECENAEPTGRWSCAGDLGSNENSSRPDELQLVGYGSLNRCA
ncbi:hypothetical protein F1880_003080 [Penicillium rolfsii]|nr:hypothetical protein F1880_003080 [Penicillium rolfsii]